MNKIKKLMKEITGGGLSDDIMKNFNSKTRANFNRYGDMPITHLQAARQPIGFGKKIMNEATMHGLMNFLNKISGYKETNEPDTLFHIYMIIRLKDGPVMRLEKNALIELYEYTPLPFPIEEWIDLDVSGLNLTLNSMMQKTVDKYGPERVFKYEAYRWNCQYFCLSMLISNNIPFTYAQKKWVMQNVAGIASSLTRRIIQYATDIGAKIDLKK